MAKEWNNEIFYGIVTRKNLIIQTKCNPLVSKKEYIFINKKKKISYNII